MTRTVLDQALRRWEVFAAAGRRGATGPGRIVFQCVTDDSEPIREWIADDSRSRLEARVIAADATELRQLLEASTPSR